MDITDEDREYIANMIRQGYTEGLTGSEEGEGENIKSVRISWSLKVEKWED